MTNNINISACKLQAQVVAVFVCLLLTNGHVLSVFFAHFPSKGSDDPPPPSHSNRPLETLQHSTPPERKMKETLSKKHSDALKHYTSEGITDNVIYKEGIKNLHTAAVARAIANQRDNKVLNQPAPRIDKSEATLPRKTRSILAQLRSGYSTYPNSYLHRINPAKYPSDKCPDCNLE